MVRVFALSDIHVDYDDNMAWIGALSAEEYGRDVLLLAGDVSHRQSRLREAFSLLKARFSEIFFVPGNHDLWIFRDDYADSLAKFGALLELCAELGIKTRPQKVGEGGEQVWILPLFSWYVLPEEGEESLFMPKRGEDPSLESWADSHFVRWPKWPRAVHAASYFARLNEVHVQKTYDAPVISFSHFLPRADLILSTTEEDTAAGDRIPDVTQSFNFSRVAGVATLDDQLRRAGAKLHVYGHQHRNRYRTVDGVTYVSHCLGYRRERDEGMIRYLDRAPRQVWPI